MGMDNPVTGLTILKIQLDYYNFNLLSFKLSKMIIAVLHLRLYGKIFNILEYFNGATCFIISYIILIDKKWIICNKS